MFNVALVLPLLSAATLARAVALDNTQSAAHRRAAAGVVPTEPSPGRVYNAGADCNIQWNPDTSGAATWKQTKIELMTGSNVAMTSLITVTTIDGTDAGTTQFKWPCPTVSKNAPIYFYQFTHGNAQDPTWTTRFTIASSTGAVVSAEHAKQADGQAIPWGIGALVGGANGGANGNSTTGSSSTAGGSSSATSGSATSSMTSSAPGSTSSTSKPATSTGTTSSNTTAAASTNSVAGQFVAVNAAQQVGFLTSIGLIALLSLAM